MNANRPCLVGPPALWQEAQGLLGDTQAAFKLLMETAREREAALEGLEGQLEAAKGLAESLRRARDEAVADSQARLFILFVWVTLPMQAKRAWQHACSCTAGCGWIA